MTEAMRLAFEALLNFALFVLKKLFNEFPYKKTRSRHRQKNKETRTRRRPEAA